MRLLAWPQVQVLVLPLGMVVAGGGVVVDTGEGVVVARHENCVKSVTVLYSKYSSTHQISNLW